MRRLMMTLFAAVAVSSGVAQGQSPNVVIFYADDMGIGDVGCYGCMDIRTPNIDALARTGVRFTHYYSAAPICSPSRAALVTGRYPHRAGVPTNVSSLMGKPGMPPEQITFAELAKTVGYATGLVGKWHLGSDYRTQANAQGFDYFFGYHACIDYWSHMFYYGGNVPHYHDLYRNREEIFENGKYVTHLITREATRFIDDHKNGPFLLYVPFHAPHYPTQAPVYLMDMYKHLPRKRQLYAALVAGMEESIGRIVDRLRYHKLIADTLVFFMSDNGASVESRANGGGGSNGPFRGHKFSLFEGGIRMPAVVSWPGRIPQNQTRDQLAIAIDVLPTIAEAIGAKIPAGHAVDGRSWMPLFADAGAPGHETLFWEWNKQHAVRQGKWKVVRNGLIDLHMSKWDRAQGDDAVFLSNLEADPGETTNLRHQHPELAARLLKRHDAWLEDVSRPVPRPDETRHDSNQKRPEAPSG